MPKSRGRRAGRKSNPDAKRKQTTRTGRGVDTTSGAVQHGPTAELIARRRELTGDSMITETLPLLAMRQGVWITQDMYDAGWEFAQDAWAYFGPPDSCQSTYEKLVAGFYDAKGAPLIDQSRSDKRLARAEERYKGAVAALVLPGESRRVLNQVNRVTRDMQFPALMVKILNDRNPTRWDIEDYARLMDGLSRLAALRNKRTTTSGPDKEAA